MKVLVVTSEPISAERLRAALDGVPIAEVEVMVVAPALHSSALRFWLSDADEAIARAERVEHETVGRLASRGVAVAGDTGESDVSEAVHDALTTFPADRILLFTHPAGAERYREEVDPDELGRELGVPVERHVVAPDTSR